MNFVIKFTIKNLALNLGVWIFLLSYCSSSFAGKENFLQYLLSDLVEELGRYNEFNEAGGFQKTLTAIRSCEGSLPHKETEKEFYRKKVARIEAIMEKYGHFIPLSLNPEWAQSKDEISGAPIPQELWVEVMENNPSYYKEKKYCPDTYREVVIHGKIIGMCPEFTPDNILTSNKGKGDSDEEFISQMNLIYEKAGAPFRFRRDTREEYHWADTDGGRSPKLEVHAQLPHDDPKFLGKFTPYWQISDKNPKDLTLPSPSGEHQPRSILDNALNELGFRRGSGWEWVENMDGSYRDFVGGSWCDYPRHVASGFPYWVIHRIDIHGPSRLVKIILIDIEISHPS